MLALSQPSALSYSGVLISSEGGRCVLGHTYVHVRCDRQGRFVCGGINLENVDAPADVWKPLAHVFRVEPSTGVKRVLPDEVCLLSCVCLFLGEPVFGPT